MNIIKVKNYEAMSKKALELVIHQLNMKEDSTLGLATGSTPVGLYQQLIVAHKNRYISFKDVKTFNLDEYIGLDRNHPESYFSFMNRHLFEHIDISEDNIHLPNNDINRLEEDVKAYNDLLSKNTIDLQILGIGTNGHIGFNEPGTPFEQETFIVDLDMKTREDNARFFDSIDSVPKQAITMGIKNIMKANHILLLASGANKAEAIKKMVDGPVDITHPASVLQLHPNCTVIVDEAAASQL